MPLKRQTNKSDSENAQKQMDAEMIQNVRNPQHIAYCIENKATLTFTAFSEEFKLFKKDFAHSRYMNIISRHLPDDFSRLSQEFNRWKSSRASKKFWSKKSRLVMDLEANLRGAEYVPQEIQVLPDANCPTSVSVPSVVSPDVVIREKPVSVKSQSTPSLKYQRLLSISDKITIERNHSRISNKWKLKTGAYVEDLIYYKAKEFQYEQ